MSSLPPGEPADEVGLLHEPMIRQNPLSLGIRQLKVIPANNLRDKFRHLEERNILSQTSSRPSSKLLKHVNSLRRRSWRGKGKPYRQEIPLHQFQSRLIRLQPPLRPELFSVRTID